MASLYTDFRIISLSEQMFNLGKALTSEHNLMHYLKKWNEK